MHILQNSWSYSVARCIIQVLDKKKAKHYKYNLIPWKSYELWILSFWGTHMVDDSGALNTF